MAVESKEAILGVTELGAFLRYFTGTKSGSCTGCSPVHRCRACSYFSAKAHGRHTNAYLSHCIGLNFLEEKF